MTDTPKIAFIKGRWHAEIVDKALTGFEKRIAGLGTRASMITFTMSGAIETPLLVKKLGHNGKVGRDHILKKDEEAAGAAIMIANLEI